MRIRWSQPYNEEIERYRICIDSGLMTNDYDYMMIVINFILVRMNRLKMIKMMMEK